MTALLKVQYSETITKADACLFDWDSTEMFPSGSAPSDATSRLDGDAVHMICSAATPISMSDAMTGDGTQMFSSSSAPQAAGSPQTVTVSICSARLLSL